MKRSACAALLVTCLSSLPLSAQPDFTTPEYSGPMARIENRGFDNPGRERLRRDSFGASRRDDMGYEENIHRRQETYRREIRRKQEETLRANETYRIIHMND
ncbi:MAG: hypothetical protein WC989_05650 [Micavibrio sp.]